MNILAVIARIRLEIQALIAADDGREYVLGRVGEYFDALAKVISIPGPDAWARGLLLLVTGLVYDVIAKADADSEVDESGISVVWAVLPPAPASVYAPLPTNGG